MYKASNKATVNVVDLMALVLNKLLRSMKGTVKEMITAKIAARIKSKMKVVETYFFPSSISLLDTAAER